MNKPEKKRRKRIIGYTIKNWGMVLKKTNIKDFNYVEHDHIYRDRMACVRTKVCITIEEIN